MSGPVTPALPTRPWQSINVGFRTGSAISVVGFLVLGFFYFRFDNQYLSGKWASLTPYETKQAWWVNFGMDFNPVTREGESLDMRPAWTCLIGIILAVASTMSPNTGRARIHAGQGTGQSLQNRACDQHHPGHRRRL